MVLLPTKDIVGVESIHRIRLRVNLNIQCDMFYLHGKIVHFLHKKVYECSSASMHAIMLA
jgi:hypothetical protein